MPRFYLTTAIDYVNNRPHLGTAYEKIAADVIARYHRLIGDEVRFVMGNDEHSQNVFKRAREQGLDPLAYCDRMEAEFREVWGRLNISFDDFIRTTEPRHKTAVQAMVRRSLEKGDIYEGIYEGWYCVSCEEFKPEKGLVDGRCPVHRTRPDWIKEKNYFFKLSRYRDALLAHYAAHPEFVAPESRRNEMVQLLKGGLDDISVSRAGQAWGIPLPHDPGSVVYVWYDALINYAAAVGYGTDDALFDYWWNQSDQPHRQVIHLVGKDITRFHCVVWPAMLLSAGLPLPTQIFGHGFVLFKGEKMSKSLGTVIDPLDAVEKFGPDPLRLFLCREIVFGQDGDFTWELFEKAYNADLANNLGNLVNRLSSMAQRYRDGRLTGSDSPDPKRQVVTECVLYYKKECMDRLHLSGATVHAFSAVDAANAMIENRKPWNLAKQSDPGELDAVLWNVSEALRIAAVLLSPFMPASCSEILVRLGVPSDISKLDFVRDTTWQTSGERTLMVGAPLWPRLEPKESSVSDPTPPAESASLWPLESRISIDDFMKIDLRVAKVLAAERVPNSKRLITLRIDLGTEQRTLVAGIAEAYEADALVGRTVAIVANLKPAKLMGIESNGMVLAASPDGGNPMLVCFDEAPAPGTRIR